MILLLAAVIYSRLREVTNAEFSHNSFQQIR